MWKPKNIFLLSFSLSVSQVFDSPLFDNESETPTMAYQGKVYHIIRTHDAISKKTRDIYDMRHRQGKTIKLIQSIVDELIDTLTSKYQFNWN